MRLAPPDRLHARVQRVRDSLSARTLDGVVVTSLPNIAYLTGFFASAAALILTQREVVLIGDGRYTESLAGRGRECPFIHPRQLATGHSYEQGLLDALVPLRGATLGFESNHLTVSRHRYLTQELQKAGWDSPLVPCDGLVEGLRAQKDAWEVSVLRDAGSRLSNVAKCILSSVLEGRTESEVAGAIDLELRRVGFERPAFDTIVAAGVNAAAAHGRAGQRRMAPGDVVLLDFGGVLDGYCTDLSRTIVVGPADRRARRLIEQVVEAQRAAFAAVRPGAAPESVDAAARGALAEFGIAEAFTHGTGHGLGLEVHEAPRISRARVGQAEPLLAPGMIVTLEPGVYFPGWGGVRIEDDVLITNDGAEWLTDVPRIL